MNRRKSNPFGLEDLPSGRYLVFGDTQSVTQEEGEVSRRGWESDALTAEEGTTAC